MSTHEGSCKDMGRLLGAHVDGQLDAVTTLEVEDHLAACESCRERAALDRAIRGSLKKAVRTSAPSDVRARMLAAMAGEQAREERREDAAKESAAAKTADVQPIGKGMLRHWRTMLPVASAAAVALAWGIAGQQPMARGSDVRMGAGFGNDELLREFVDVHSHPLRPEASDPKVVRGFERDIGVPVRVPQPKNARFVGARLLPVHGERAVVLQYDVEQANGVQRVSLFVYDPQRVRVGTHLAPRAVGTAEVRVGQSNGYSVAVAQHGGVGYAVTSAMDAESSAKLVAAADSD